MSTYSCECESDLGRNLKQKRNVTHYKNLSFSGLFYPHYFDGGYNKPLKIQTLAVKVILQVMIHVYDVYKSNLLDAKSEFFSQRLLLRDHGGPTNKE